MPSHPESTAAHRSARRAFRSRGASGRTPAALRLLAAVALALVAVLIAWWWRAHGPSPHDLPADAVRYRVVFSPMWTRARFPHDYPDTSLLHRPHFSGWIGTGHDDAYTLFAEGAIATPGLEDLAEKGRQDRLADDIARHASAGHATVVGRCDPLRDLTRTATFDLVVDPRHPRASAVAMIGPSPDWFVGFDTDLREGAGWATTRRIAVLAWDAGSDDGTTFFAPDRDTVPKRPMSVARHPQFARNGRPLPLGIVTLTRDPRR